MYFCFPKQLLIVYRSTKLQNMWQLIATECVHMHSQRLHAQSRAYKKKKDYQHFKSCLELWKRDQSTPRSAV